MELAIIAKAPIPSPTGARMINSGMSNNAMKGLTIRMRAATAAFVGPISQ